MWIFFKADGAFRVQRLKQLKKWNYKCFFQNNGYRVAKLKIHYATKKYRYRDVHQNPSVYLRQTYLSTTKSLLGWGAMLLRAYWYTSVCLSSVSRTFHCSRSPSHRWRSRRTRFSSTDGGASASTEMRHRRSGVPSPTWETGGEVSVSVSVCVNPKTSPRSICIRLNVCA